MTKRVLFVALAALVLSAGAIFVLGSDDGGEQEAEHGETVSAEAMADALGTGVMLHVKRGHVPGRSAEVYLVPQPHFYLAGDVDLMTLGTDNPWTANAHPSPWNYTARVPLIFYGPGYAPSGKKVYEEVDIADVAPTYAEMLGVHDLDADGEPLTEVLGGRTAKKNPKVVFSIVLDGGGWNALQEHPDSWPTIKELESGGTSYLNATIGSAPAITGALHATFGTGVYPVEHGLPGNQMRSPEGENVDTWLEEADGRYLESVTVSELWDEQNGNKPLVGTVSYEGWHLGMIGKGALREGGDKDVAALWHHEENEWWINEEYYELPNALAETDVERLERYEKALDPRDGLNDGDWFGHTLDELQETNVRPGHPGYVRFTGDAVIDTMREMKLGSDAITDMFWVEMKMPDFAGHLWNMVNPEQADVLRETDRQIARFKAELDKTVGRGNYVIMISADHGQQPFPDLLGGWRINTNELENDIQNEFGDVIEKVTTTDVFMDMQALEDEGLELDEVAQWLSGYTIGENVPANRPGADRVPESRLDDPIFAAAFSTDYIQSLDDAAIEGFGDSDYPEGDYTIEPEATEE
ncbi:MAG: alkaline phosphatase family protein [Actinomycetota bacterium]|nr:alkaline phosphatase family protein [Actinomycetota bacterium]